MLEIGMYGDNVEIKAIREIVKVSIYCIYKGQVTQLPTSVVDQVMTEICIFIV
jgi:hypothetical protein